MAHPTPAAGRRPAFSLALTAFVVVLALGARPASAAVHTIEGASSDSILDGFPGLAPFDGTPDFGNNALAVAFQSGATEERAFIEFPLAALAGVAPGDVAEATLTFNVDDVLSTFGPGTTFDGTASSPIAIAIYSGDGVVGLSDWGLGSALTNVTIGNLTDASLASSGPVAFTVTLTGRLRDLLLANATHLGVRFSTTDGPTGTSLDDLGSGGSGPPGVGGARKPFLTVEVSEAVPTPTQSPRPTPTPTGVTGPTPTPNMGPTPTPGSNPTPTPGATSTPQGTATPAGTGTPGPTATSGGGATPTPRPSNGPTPVATPTSATATPTPGPTGPLQPTATPAATRTPNGGPTPRGRVVIRTDAAPASLIGAMQGDQLVSYYESSAASVTFLNVRNDGATPLNVEVLFYDEGLETAVAEIVAVPAQGTRTIDPTALPSGAVVPGRGIAFATGVDESGRPIVTGALSGTVTIADVPTGAAWGGWAIARRAFEASGGGLRAPFPGDPIDGERIFLERLQPNDAQLPAFYAVGEGTSRAPARFVMLSFRDLPGAAFDAEAATTDWRVGARRNDGSEIEVADASASGVLVTDLDVLLGEAARDSAGSVRFEVGTVAAENRLIFFHQSVGGFGIGFLVPPVGPPESTFSNR